MLGHVKFCTADNCVHQCGLINLFQSLDRGSYNFEHGHRCGSSINRSCRCMAINQSMYCMVRLRRACKPKLMNPFFTFSVNGFSTLKRPQQQLLNKHLPHMEAVSYDMLWTVTQPCQCPVTLPSLNKFKQYDISWHFPRDKSTKENLAHFAAVSGPGSCGKNLQGDIWSFRSDSITSADFKGELDGVKGETCPEHGDNTCLRDREEH